MWKLTPKYAGPFKVVQRIGEVAYKLQLPSTAKVHPVFHVSQLKRGVKQNDKVITDLPPLDEQGQQLLVPTAILEKRIVKRNNAAVGQWLIQWSHLPVEEATWEDAEDFMTKFPNYSHEVMAR